ncbi:MAG: YveK family protein [Suipraeoptans sp.]
MSKKPIMEDRDDEISIDIVELFWGVIKKIHWMIILGAIAMLGTYIISSFFITPMYTSTTKMYVLSKQDGDSSLTYNDLQTGTQLTKDYMELAKSRLVIDEVIAILELDESADTLTSRISVETPEGTRMLNISVEDEDPKQAKLICDTLRDTVSIQISKLMDADLVSTIEEADLPRSQSSPNITKNVVFGGAIGVLIALLIVLFLFIKDETIKTAEDVERYLGINVLASMPTQKST